MPEARYFRDYKHSYMILPCGLTQPEKSYPCRLLTMGKLEDVLRCSLRYVNGAAFFYYDISSRTTLESLYRGRQLSYLQVKELFRQLYGIYCRLGDCCMDEAKLVLLPEYIYYDLSRQKYIGLYYPDYEEEKPYEALMDYLLEHMDNQDERLADLIYQMYERAEAAAFTLSDALGLLEEREEISAKEREAIPAENRGKQEQFFSKTNMPSFPVFEEDSEDDFVVFEDGSEKVQKEQKEQPAASEKKNRFSVFLITLSALGLVGIACIYGFYELSDGEMTTLLGCGALMGVCLLSGFIGICSGRRKEKITVKKEKEAASQRDEEAHDPLEGAISLEQVLSKTVEPGIVMPERRMDERPADERESWGDTVFFDNTRYAEYKLYARDRKNKRHIELSKFPYTVGKMMGCVDCVLEDDSVSRLHVRFEKNGDVVQMTDMNSTNGTFKNGFRLQPQETVEIEPGDEIRFGNLNYCYR